MKRYIKSSYDYEKDLQDTWRDLSPSSQMAVSFACDKHEQGYEWYDAIREAVSDVNNGNAEPEYEDEDFYQDEASIDDVTKYIELRYGVEV